MDAVLATNVPPSISNRYIADDVSAYAEIFGDVALAVASSEQLFYLDNFLVGQLRHWALMRVAARNTLRTTLCYLVRHVVGVRANKQMIYVHAGRVIAFMKHLLACLAVGLLPDPPMD